MHLCICTKYGELRTNWNWHLRGFVEVVTTAHADHSTPRPIMDTYCIFVQLIATMRVQIVKLRESGRRLPKDNPHDPLTGELTHTQYRGNKWGYFCLTLVFVNAIGMKEIKGQLLEPRLINLCGECMTFQGLEQVKGQTFHQCWKVLVCG